MTKGAPQFEVGPSTPPADTIVCLSLTEWTAMPQNSHHLMREAARRGYCVLYVDPVGLRRMKLRRKDLMKLGRRLRQAMRPVVSVEDRITRLAPVGIPLQDTRIGSAINGRLLALQVKRALKRIRPGRSVLWSYTPHFLQLGAGIGSALSIYYRVDDYTTSPYINSDYMARQEAKAVSVADLCVAASRQSAEVMGAAKKCILVPNGIDLAIYREDVAKADPLPGIGRPRLLFTGTFDTWVDLELLSGLASKHPDWQVVLAGEGKIPLDGVTALPNVHYLGLLPYDQLPALMAHSDIGLVPYHVNQFTISACIGKIYQYLAVGLPVVSTPVLDRSDYGDHVTLAPADASAFGDAVERLLAEDSPEERRARQLYGREQTWRARFEVLEAEIRRLLAEERRASGKERLLCAK